MPLAGVLETTNAVGDGSGGVVFMIQGRRPAVVWQQWAASLVLLAMWYVRVPQRGFK